VARLQSDRPPRRCHGSVAVAARSRVGEADRKATARRAALDAVAASWTIVRRGRRAANWPNASRSHPATCTPSSANGPSPASSPAPASPSTPSTRRHPTHPRQPRQILNYAALRRTRWLYAPPQTLIFGGKTRRRSGGRTPLDSAPLIGCAPVPLPRMRGIQRARYGLQVAELVTSRRHEANRHTPYKDP
jgi:hypothetical protein